MRKILFMKKLLLLILLILIGCSDPNNGPYEEYYESGNIFNRKIFIEGYKKNGKLDGLFKIYSENGKILQEKNYENGELIGSYKEYFENGIIKIKGNYLNNELEGLVEVYYNNRRIKEKQNFKNGKLNGLIKLYNKSGRLSEEAEYKEDKLHGFFKYYYPNGKTKGEGNHKNGELHGLYKEYYDHNFLVSRASNYQNGKLHGSLKEYFLNRGNYGYKIDLEENYKNGKKNGRYKKYANGHQRGYRGYSSTADGELMDEGYYKDDLKHGEWKRYRYTNGRSVLWEVTNYKNGMKDGPYVRISNLQGSLTRAEGSYKNDEQHGIWKTYETGGFDDQLRIEKEYNEGKPLWMILDGTYIQYDENGKIIRNRR
jgi:antitoxin component YwqK of YwqJK toxin-antitoxin module